MISLARLLSFTPPLLHSFADAHTGHTDPLAMGLYSSPWNSSLWPSGSTRNASAWFLWPCLVYANRSLWPLMKIPRLGSASSGLPAHSTLILSLPPSSWPTCSFPTCFQEAFCPLGPWRGLGTISPHSNLYFGWGLMEPGVSAEHFQPW